MTGRTKVEDEEAIRKLVERRAAATEQKQAGAVAALFTVDATGFELAPPLKWDAGRMRDAAEMDAWFRTWDGQIRWETRELTVEVDGDVGFAHALDRMRGVKTDGQRVDMWLRTTIGVRRVDGEWKIAHCHSSVPFYMDGSLRAAVDLQP